MTKEKSSFLSRLSGAVQGDEQDKADETVSIPASHVTEPEPVAAPIPTPPPAPEPEVAEEVMEESWEEENVEEGQLTLDVYQTDEHLIIKSTIAGVKPENLDVSINNDVLTIRGERQSEESINENDYFYKECYWGSFSRSVVLPTDVIAEKIDASLRNGILTIKLPKADTTKTRRIQVRGF